MAFLHDGLTFTGQTPHPHIQSAPQDAADHQHQTHYSGVECEEQDGGQEHRGKRQLVHCLDRFLGCEPGPGPGSSSAGAPVGQAAVVEDALAGVEAGRNGGFGLVVGVARAGAHTPAAELRRHGADLVIANLADLLTDGNKR
ncbi:hypothetical protein ACIREE_39200 [Streptomyces sp. NPDC102467]|uniref:hypothetical protein n=1 Tax=Streptomyces sp. NPDC102467 TaxID=3366179 RepID=UPI003802E701